MEATKINTQAIAKDAVERFLDRRGCEILQRDCEYEEGHFDLVVREDEALVFVRIKASTSPQQGFPKCSVTALDRERFEAIATRYLLEHPGIAECDVRCDEVGVMPLDMGRAILRRHINVFGKE